MSEPARHPLSIADLPALLAEVPALVREVRELRAEVEALRRQRTDTLADLVPPKALVDEGLVKMGTLRDYLLDRHRNGLAQHVHSAPGRHRNLLISRQGFAAWIKRRR